MLSNMEKDGDKLQVDLDNAAAVIGERAENYIIFMGNSDCWCFRTNNGMWAEFVCRRFVMEKEEKFKRELNNE